MGKSFKLRPQFTKLGLALLASTMIVASTWLLVNNHKANSNPLLQVAKTSAKSTKANQPPVDLATIIHKYRRLHPDKMFGHYYGQRCRGMEHPVKREITRKVWAFNTEVTRWKNRYIALEIVLNLPSGKTQLEKLNFVNKAKTQKIAQKLQKRRFFSAVLKKRRQKLAAKINYVEKHINRLNRVAATY